MVLVKMKITLGHKVTPEEVKEATEVRLERNLLTLAVLCQVKAVFTLPNT
jgi:hypothetical protein